MRSALIMIFILLLSSPCFCLSEEGKLAESKLSQAQLTIERMQSENLSVQKPSDIYLEASQIYKAQIALENAKGDPDYSLITKRADEIDAISKQAFGLVDELSALKVRINESSANTSLVMDLYAQALKEFKDERYDSSQNLINQGYQKLFEEESTQARVKAAYDAMSKTLESYLRENYQMISLSIISIAIIMIILRSRIRAYLLKRHLDHLNVRKDILQGLIAKSQGDYFEKGIIGEDTYKIRVAKFEELIRDINRQIPLAREQLVKAGGQEKSVPKSHRK
jgi:hypothetical protein